MGKIQVEVFYQDGLQEIRVDQRQMEVPNAIRSKSIAEWFVPAGGRITWKGLPEEIRKMDCSSAENSEYSFQFNGPEDKKKEFLDLVRNHNLGEESESETKEKKCRNICRMQKTIIFPEMKQQHLQAIWLQRMNMIWIRRSMKWRYAIRMEVE